MPGTANKKASTISVEALNLPGSHLLSQAVSSLVPSAKVGLTFVFGMGTGVSLPPSPPDIHNCTSRSSPRPISTSQLNALRRLHLWPIYLVVFQGSYRSRVGNLISGWASRLDAFSAYPVRTWLPSCALGKTTGAPEVRPSRSSRTKDSSPQISYARDG